MEESEEHNSVRQIVEKSDEFIVVKKQANKAPLGVAEPVERKGSVEGNSTTKPEVSTQGLAESEGGLARVRAAACRNKEDRFTSLFHHLDYALLERAYEALKRKAAPGIDGLDWRAYGEDLCNRPVHLIVTMQSLTMCGSFNFPSRGYCSVCNRNRYLIGYFIRSNRSGHC